MTEAFCIHVMILKQSAKTRPPDVTDVTDATENDAYLCEYVKFGAVARMNILNVIAHDRTK